MLVSALQIVAKIKDLPPDYAEHVHITGKPTRAAGGIAEVNSFSDPIQEQPYIVRIQKAEVEGNLNVNCTCPATTLCMHIVSFYAVFKGIKPPQDTAPLPLEEEEDIDKGKIDEGKESINKRRAKIYGQLLAAFAKLAELEDK